MRSTIYLYIVTVVLLTFQKMPEKLSQRDSGCTKCCFCKFSKKNDQKLSVSYSVNGSKVSPNIILHYKKKLCVYFSTDDIVLFLQLSQ